MSIAGPDTVKHCHCAFQVLQKLGKADETRDVVFEEMVTNFTKQMVITTSFHSQHHALNFSYHVQAVLMCMMGHCFTLLLLTDLFSPQGEGTKLQKDLKAYMTAVKSKAE